MDWDGDVRPWAYYPLEAARPTNDYETARDRSDADGAPRFAGVQQPGYVAEGYPERVVMRKKPDDQQHLRYHPDRSVPEGYPTEHDGTKPLRQSLVRDVGKGLASPGAMVSGNPQDLYARVVKPSERSQNMIGSDPHSVDATRSGFDRGPVSSSAGFDLRPDDRRLPSVAPSDGLSQQRDIVPSHDHNMNKSLTNSFDASPSRPSSQPRVYGPSDRHIDGTPMFGDPSKDSFRRPVTSPDTRPDNLPLPASMRGQYIDEIAATKTPHAQQDLMQAKVLSQYRHGQPSYFQYPAADNAPRQVSISISFVLLLYSTGLKMHQP